MPAAAPSPDELGRARAELGLAAGADDAAVRRAFRELARTHHPDRGGDPARFDRVRRAFALLSDGAPASAPRVRFGRPSRRAPADGVGEDVERPAPTPLEATERSALRAGRRPLDGPALAAWLLAPGGGLIPFRASSRAPGARSNRYAHALAEGSTSRLEVGPVTVGGAIVLRTDLVALPRRARRALDAIRLEGAERGRGWVRSRGSSATRLRQERDVAARHGIAVAEAVDELERLLDRLDWPLTQWRTTG